MLQHELIAAVRAAVPADAGLDAALMYGSFAKGEADEYSDVEFWFFHTPAAHDRLDPRGWIEALGHPVTYVLRNEFGAHVAFFEHLVRGEFHFATTDQYPLIADWPERHGLTVLLDRSGRLAPAVAALPGRMPLPPIGRFVAEHCDPWANWMVLCTHVLRRGELLRALDALGHAQRHLLWMARMADGATGHWLTPSRAAELDLGPDTAAALYAGTAPAAREPLAAALRAALAEGRRCWEALAARDPDAGRPPRELFAQLAALLDEAAAGTSGTGG